MKSLGQMMLRLVQWPLVRRQERLMATRRDYFLADFTAHFDRSNVSDKAAATVWKTLRKVAVVPDFRPFPDDSIHETFGLIDEDLAEEVLQPVLDSLGAQEPSAEEMKRMSRLVTVDDLVRFVSQQESVGR